MGSKKSIIHFLDSLNLTKYISLNVGLISWHLFNLINIRKHLAAQKIEKSNLNSYIRIQ